MNMSSQLIPTESNSCTLYELEDNLQALVNSIDLAEEAPARALILEEIGQALRKTKEKRDAVVAFLKHCELQLVYACFERLAFFEPNPLHQCLPNTGRHGQDNVPKGHGDSIQIFNQNGVGILLNAQAREVAFEPFDAFSTG